MPCLGMLCDMQGQMSLTVQCVLCCVVPSVRYGAVLWLFFVVLCHRFWILEVLGWGAVGHIICPSVRTRHLRYDPAKHSRLSENKAFNASYCTSSPSFAFLSSVTLDHFSFLCVTVRMYVHLLYDIVSCCACIISMAEWTNWIVTFPLFSCC